jgi:hypothetical protein
MGGWSGREIPGIAIANACTAPAGTTGFIGVTVARELLSYQVHSFNMGQM